MHNDTGFLLDQMWGLDCHGRLYGSTGNRDPADKRLKLDQPPGINLESTDTCPIIATKLALDTIRANESAIENPVTGKVTAVVTMLKVFGDKINKVPPIKIILNHFTILCTWQKQWENLY